MEEVFISYEDEKGQEFSGYVKLVKQDNYFITFITNYDNEITIPVHRLIKIKRKSE